MVPPISRTAGPLTATPGPLSRRQDSFPSRRSNRHTRLICISVTLGLLGYACQSASETRDPLDRRVLVFSKTAAYRHASIESGIAALTRLANERDVEIVTTEDATVFRMPELEAYDAVVFLSTTGDVLNDDQQEALMTRIRSGGGFVGIHSATDTEYDWAWYGRLVGGYFVRHPSNPNVREGTLSIADPSHPATASLPNPWTRSDEWYEIRDLAPALEILITIDETTYKRPDENPIPTPRPIAWYHEFEGGRAFYTAMGHTPDSFDNPLFLDHIWGGIVYALGPEHSETNQALNQ